MSERTPIVPGPNGSLWGARPVMRLVPEGSFIGRLFIEVWNEDVQVVSCGTNPTIVQRARVALQTQQPTLRDRQVPWSDEPVTGTRARDGFLGRVIVEVWDDQAVIGLTGQEQPVIERARQRLATLPT